MPSMTARGIRLRASFVAVLLLAAACADKSRSGPGTDSALARDLALANQQTAQPTFQDTAVAPAPTPASIAKNNPPTPARARVGHEPNKPKVEQPRRVAQAPTTQPTPTVQIPAPAPAPTPAPAAPAAPAAAPGPARGEIGTGTGVGLTSGTKVCTSTNLPGDKLVATVNEPITGSNGAVIPAGSAVVLEVASVSKGDDANGPQITFRVRSVVVNDKTYTVAANVVPLGAFDKTKVAGTDPNAEKKKVIGGAIAGAILGQILGHDTKGTVIGAAAGAAGGAVLAKRGEQWEACLPAGSAMRLTLSAPIVM
jgi:hypothetical protein